MTYGGTTYGGTSYGSMETTTRVSDAGVASVELTTSGSVATQATASIQSASSGSVGVAQGNAVASLTAAGKLSNGVTSFEAPIDFRVTRDGTTVEDAAFDVAPLVDTANPFGDYVVVKIDDRGGEKFEEYGRGTRIDIAITENFGIDYTERFTGYVVERRELDQQGSDTLEVEAYSFDQFLRRNTVTNDQTGNLISEALADIIQTDTPVTYDAAKVSIGEDQTLTRSYQGEAVETVLRDLAFKSVNEEFGVDDELDFFFRPRETEHIDRGVDNTQWFNFDIPELGKETINEVEVWFDDGNESVIVDDGTDKLDLQDSLNLAEPGTQRAELQRPLLTDISDAEDVGRKYLKFRTATLSGTVTTFGLFDAEPGDTIDITIAPRGIDGEFVIAAVEYRWGRDETVLTIVEKRGDVDDILADLTDSVQRQEMEGADRDAPKNRITTTNARAIVTPSWDVAGETPDGRRLANDGRNSIRDGWIGDGLPDIAEIRVGDDNSGLSRSNSGLANQTATATVSETLPDSTTARYEATLTQTGVAEVGLFESDGTLITRATFDSPVDVDGTVQVDLSVANDDSVSRGVLTTGGQTAVRDTIAANSPNTPDEYAYGSDGTAVAESDTALGSEEVRVGLKEIEIQSADTTSEWNDITSIPDDVPLQVSNGALEQTQTAFTQEAQDVGGNAVEELNTDYTGGTARTLQFTGDTVEQTFTVDHTVPAADVGLYIRVDTGSAGSGPAIDVTLNGDTWNPVGSQTTFSLGWNDFGNDTFGGSSTYSGGDLTAGSYTVTVEAVDNGDDAHFIDVIAPVDLRYVPSASNLDNTLNESSGHVDDPQLFAEQVSTSLSTATTRRLVSEARFESVWNDTTNNQFVELSNDGSNFTRVSNSESGSVTFGSENEDVDTNLGLSNFPVDGTNPQDDTPRFGYNAQAVDEWALFVTIEAVATDDIGESLTRAIVAPNTITGTTIRESGLFGNDTLLTRHELAEFTLESGQRLASSETSVIRGDN